MQLLKDKGCTIVDTTWVSKVWNTVEKHKKGDYTSIIHGKYNHEITTSSFAAKYLVVLNLAGGVCCRLHYSQQAIATSSWRNLAALAQMG